MNHNLSSRTKRMRVKIDGTNYQRAAGTATDTSEAIDTRGYEAVLLRMGWGAITSGGAQSFKVQQSSDDGSSDSYADLAGTNQTVADTDDNKVFECEIFKPKERYLKVVTSRATQNSAIDFLEAILYNPIRRAVTQDSTVAATETFNSPAEGTA
jgi:hypothetical protein